MSNPGRDKIEMPSAGLATFVGDATSMLVFPAPMDPIAPPLEACAGSAESAQRPCYDSPINVPGARAGH